MKNQITPDFSAILRKVETTPKAMLTVERDGNQTNVRINSSSLSILQSCPRKSYYLLKQGLKAKAPSPALIFGTAIHKALEVFYETPKAKRGEMPDRFEEYASTMANGFEPPTSSFLYDSIKAFIAAADPLGVLPDTDKRSIQSGIWLLTHYFKAYLNDIYVIHHDEFGPLTERTVEAVLIEGSDLRITLFGTIDVILRNEATGEILPGDHKTTSMMGNEFLNRCKPNHQYTGYLWLAREKLGITSENFMVNGIGVKAKPVTARGGPPTFTRQITRRTEEDFREFADAVDFAVRSYLMWDENNCWPLGHVDSCASYGGCGFLDVCSAPNALRNNILEANFESL